ncbi:hypothetical protein NDU88_004798 [Pleurodeles waltl]|uniref:Huntingtin interacting protein K n=1 Tax=Pleurodeles waltl TaxID=8319 RepID=A0AAV7W605_PLEWA|nr:hypothetical protein NDU88_004798 [Pleurodeles waltl]
MAHRGSELVRRARGEAKEEGATGAEGEDVLQRDRERPEETRTPEMDEVQSTMGPDPGEETLLAHSSTILAAIKDTKQALETQIVAEVEEAGILSADHRKLAEQA